MQPTTFVNVLITSSFCFCLLVGLPTGVVAESINIDEILYEMNTENDPSPDDLEPRVEMSFDSTSKLLTVVLSNEAGYEGLPDAGHLLTGLGFNLLPGVFIEDMGERDSSIQLPAGSTIINPEDDPGSLQDEWGYRQTEPIQKGHFYTVAELTTNMVLSCMAADAAVTFSGNSHPRSVARMGGVDYGLQGLDPTPGHSKKPSILNSLEFKLYFDGPTGTDWDGLLDHINSNPVVVSYGSSCTSIAVPEPATLTMCLALFCVALIFRLRRCRAE